MEKIVKNWRYWLMGAVALLAALNIIALPSPREEHFWLPVKVALTNGDAGRGTDRAQKA